MSKLKVSTHTTSGKQLSSGKFGSRPLLLRMKMLFTAVGLHGTVLQSYIYAFFFSRGNCPKYTSIMTIDNWKENVQLL